MNYREASIITAFTGIFLTNNFTFFQNYAEEKFGYPISTHEMAEKTFWIRLKELARDDFLQLVNSINKGEAVDSLL